MSDALRAVAEMVRFHMEEIRKGFKPGVRVTVLVRTPDHPRRDFMMTTDDPDEILKMVQRRKVQA